MLFISTLMLIALVAPTGPAMAQLPDNASPVRTGDGRRFEARDVLEAFARAYPERFSAPEQRGGDWAIRLDGEWFDWADGRLLPEGFEAKSRELSRVSFYAYPEEQPAVRALSAAEKTRLDAVLAERDRQPPESLPVFYDKLWGSPDEGSAYDRMKTIMFFGKKVLVHRDLLEEYARVEAEILALAARDRTIGKWVEGLDGISAYSWRSVAGTRTRSFHSYGVAIDLVPARAGRNSWYWLDARRQGLAWYQLPLDKRISVPRAVVQAFERHGFVWGGKWFYWDLVHFEYRPEILILNGRAPKLQAPLP